MIKYLFDNYQIITAISAIVISVLSILVSLWQLNIQRKHNYLSVQPSGYITFGDYEETIHVKLYNFGSGPMIVRKATFTKGGETKSSVIGFLPNDLPYTDFTEEVEGRTILPGNAITLVKMESEKLEEEDKFKLRNYLSDMKGVIEYTNIYENKKFTIERNFKWFSRLLEAKELQNDIDIKSSNS